MKIERKIAVDEDFLELKLNSPVIRILRMLNANTMTLFCVHTQNTSEGLYFTKPYIQNKKESRFRYLDKFKKDDLLLKELELQTTRLLQTIFGYDIPDNLLLTLTCNRKYTKALISIAHKTTDHTLISHINFSIDELDLEKEYDSETLQLIEKNPTSEEDLPTLPETSDTSKASNSAPSVLKVPVLESSKQVSRNSIDYYSNTQLWGIVSNAYKEGVNSIALDSTVLSNNMESQSLLDSWVTNSIDYIKSRLSLIFNMDLSQSYKEFFSYSIENLNGVVTIDFRLTTKALSELDRRYITVAEALDCSIPVSILAGRGVSIPNIPNVRLPDYKPKANERTNMYGTLFGKVNSYLLSIHSRVNPKETCSSIGGKVHLNFYGVKDGDALQPVLDIEDVIDDDSITDGTYTFIKDDIWGIMSLLGLDLTDDLDIEITLSSKKIKFKVLNPESENPSDSYMRITLKV